MFTILIFILGFYLGSRLQPHIRFNKGLHIDYSLKRGHRDTISFFN